MNWKFVFPFTWPKNQPASARENCNSVVAAILPPRRALEMRWVHSSHLKPFGWIMQQSSDRHCACGNREMQNNNQRKLRIIFQFFSLFRISSRNWVRRFPLHHDALRNESSDETCSTDRRCHNQWFNNCLSSIKRVALETFKMRATWL